jgi:carboxymethylenebutenolidase
VTGIPNTSEAAVGDEPGRQNVRFPSGDGEAFGYLRVPESGSGPGVVVVQEWWGLTTHVASIVERLAGAGFVALAPDLYGGPTTHDAAEAAELATALPVERAAEDLAGAVDHLVGLPAVTSATVGTIGFCMGGGFVFALAAHRPDLVSAAVPFYGLPRDTSLVPRIRAAVQGHFGLEDHTIPVDRVRAVFAALDERPGAAPAELHLYPAGHAFLNDENLIGTYDPECAAQAWDRAVAFLREHVR